MKFTPESLIEIYLNGSFTEEAQREFDALVRSDAAFAERVTQSVAERLGPLPEGLEAGIAGRLDAKREALWLAHKPSPWGGLWRVSVKAALLLAVAGGFYGGYRYFRASRYPAALTQTQIPAGEGVSSGENLGKAVLDPEDSGPANRPEMEAASRPPEDRSRSVSLSFKKMPPVSGSKLSTPMPDTASRTAENRGHSAMESAGDGGSPAGSPEKTNSLPPSGSKFEEGDALRVSVEMDKPGKAIITVLDSNGILVRRLYQGVWSQGVHLLDWDGKDEAGNPVQPGNYTVAVNADGQTMTGTLTIKANP